MASSPPRSVTKALLDVKWMLDSNLPQETRAARSSPLLTILLMKYMGSNRDLNLGLSAMLPGHSSHAQGQGMIRLATFAWKKDMDSWGPSEWAWILVLLMHRASGVLPKITPLSREQATNAATYTGCYYAISMHYKICPARPKELNVETTTAMRRIAALPRFTGDKDSMFYGAAVPGAPGGAGEGGPVVLGMEANPSEREMATDPARVFDTSWHWRRAAELLGADIPDLSGAPACSFFQVDATQQPLVLASNGRWFESTRAYIEHRLSSAVSALPEAERRDICEMIIALAKAEEAWSPETGIKEITPEEYAQRCALALKKQPPSKALKMAFKKYGIVIPEMEEAGVVHRCAGCGATPTVESKFLSCPCKNVRYCSKDCQRADWKAHKRVCEHHLASAAASASSHPSAH